MSASAHSLSCLLQSLQNRSRLGRGGEVCRCSCALCYRPRPPSSVPPFFLTRAFIISNFSFPFPSRSLAFQVTHSVSVICSAVDKGALSPEDATTRLHALTADVAFTSLPPSHAARADVLASVSKLAAGKAAGVKADASRALGALYRSQVGGGLHIKPLVLLLSGLSTEALGQIDADRGKEERLARLGQLLGQLKVLLGECQAMQGEEGALVFIANKLQSQVHDQRQHL